MFKRLDKYKKKRKFINNDWQTSREPLSKSAQLEAKMLDEFKKYGAMTDKEIEAALDAVPDLDDFAERLLHYTYGNIDRAVGEFVPHLSDVEDFIMDYDNSESERREVAEGIKDLINVPVDFGYIVPNGSNIYSMVPHDVLDGAQSKLVDRINKASDGLVDRLHLIANMYDKARIHKGGDEFQEMEADDGDSFVYEIEGEQDDILHPEELEPFTPPSPPENRNPLNEEYYD